MNCRNLSKFIPSKKHIRCFSTNRPLKSEQLHCCFRNNDEVITSLKFVPKEDSPKIPASSYHSSEHQAKIVQRMHSLQNFKAPTNDSQLLGVQVETLMQMGKPSKKDFSTSCKSLNKNYLDSVARHSRKMIYDQYESVLQRTPNPNAASRLWKNMTIVEGPGNDRSFRHQTTEPLDIKSQLMEVKKESKYPLTPSYPPENRSVVAVTTKDKADLDGVYYAKSDDIEKN